MPEITTTRTVSIELAFTRAEIQEALLDFLNKKMHRDYLHSFNRGDMVGFDTDNSKPAVQLDSITLYLNRTENA